VLKEKEKVFDLFPEDVVALLELCSEIGKPFKSERYSIPLNT
jgi:hypothetical protein